MICEMCGRESAWLESVRVEGTVLSVCKSCARFGEPVKRTGAAKGAAPAPVPEVDMEARLMEVRKRMREKDIYERIKDELVDDYGDQIRAARQRMGLSQEELGKKINEKKSVIHKLERYDMRPDDALVKKLEKALSIRLRAPPPETHITHKGGSAPLTLGDLIARAKEKR